MPMLSVLVSLWLVFVDVVVVVGVVLHHSCAVITVAVVAVDSH